MRLPEERGGGEARWRYKNLARNEGAEFRAGGTRVSDEEHRHGLFFSPTVIEANPGMEVAKEEIFGPVLPVLGYRSLEPSFLRALRFLQ